MSKGGEAGRIGWTLFQDVNLFMDLKNSRIAFCDSLDTLKKQGYPVDTFTKVPLLLDHGLIEFEALITEGKLRCVLDTGATWNILNTKSQQPIEQIIWSARTVSEPTILQIGEKDFGKTSFHLLPLNLPIPVEAILGMEFLSTHLVFIDFAHNHIYFGTS